MKRISSQRVSSRVSLPKSRATAKAVEKKVLPSLPWAIAFALVFSIYFTFQTQYTFADTNPPLATPPGGNAFPTFESLETKNDVVVGENLKVGNTIKPKSGLNLTLDADKVNFKKDLEVLGSITAGTDLFVGNALKPKGGTTLSITSPDTGFSGNAIVKGYLQVAGKTYVDGGLVVKEGLKVLNSGNNAISLNSPLLDGTTTAKDLNVTGIAGLQSLAVGDNATFNGDVLAKKNAQVWGTFFVGNGSSAGVAISPSATILKNALTVNGKTNLNDDVTVLAKFKANAIGKFSTSSGAVVNVAAGATGSPSYAKCKSGAVMLSCGAAPRPNNSWNLNDKLLSSAYIQGPLDWQTCTAYGTNMGKATVSYVAQAVCFDPKEN